MVAGDGIEGTCLVVGGDPVCGVGVEGWVGVWNVWNLEGAAASGLRLII